MNKAKTKPPGKKRRAPKPKRAKRSRPKARAAAKSEAASPPPPKSLPKRKLGVATSMRAAAGVTGLTFRTIQAAKEAGAGAKIFKSNQSVDCDLLLEWLSEHPEVLEASGEALNLALEEALKTRAERMIKEHKLAEMRGEVLPWKVAGNLILQTAVAIRAKILSSSLSDLEKQQLLRDLTSLSESEIAKRAIEKSE